MVAPAPVVYTAYKDYMVTADHDFPGSATPRLRFYLVDNTYSADAADTMSTISASIWDGGGGVATSISAECGSRTASGGVLNCADAVWSTPEDSSGATKHIVAAWVKPAAASVTDYANIVPMCLLPKEVIPDGTTLTIDPNDALGLINFNGTPA